MKKHIITRGSKLDTVDGVIDIEGYNGSLYYGTMRRLDTIEKDGEVIINPDGEGLTAPEPWSGSREDLQAMLKEVDGLNHAITWDGCEWSVIQFNVDDMTIDDSYIITAETEEKAREWLATLKEEDADTEPELIDFHTIDRRWYGVEYTMDGVTYRDVLEEVKE